MPITSQQKLALYRKAHSDPGAVAISILEMLRGELVNIVADAVAKIENGLADKVILKHIEKLKGEKGDKGDRGDAGLTPIKGKHYVDGTDGKTPEKGVDYFTPQEIAEIKKAVTPAKGIHYFTEDDINLIVDLAQAKVRPAIDGITPVAGVDFPTHDQIKKLIVEIMPKQITVEEIMKLVSPVLDSKIESKIRTTGKGRNKKYLHGGGDTVSAGSNISIVTNSDGSKTISSTGSSGSSASSGHGAPVSTPSSIGNMYVDLDTSNIYIATGIVSSADWKIIAASFK